MFSNVDVGYESPPHVGVGISFRNLLLNNRKHTSHSGRKFVIPARAIYISRRNVWQFCSSYPRPRACIVHKRAPTHFTAVNDGVSFPQLEADPQGYSGFARLRMTCTHIVSGSLIENASACIPGNLFHVPAPVTVHPHLTPGWPFNMPSTTHPPENTKLRTLTCFFRRSELTHILYFARAHPWSGRELLSATTLPFITKPMPPPHAPPLLHAFAPVRFISDFGKAKAEPENKKTAFKRAAFHLILPFMAYFKGTCLTTIDCKEHNLLKMVGSLWGEWDPERPITQTELSSKFRFSAMIRPRAF